MLAVACAAMVASTIKAREATESLTPGLVEDLASNPALRALYGTPFDLATPGGFTVWRLGMFLSAAACAWGLLTATRLLRGEEEAGRADLVHTAPITHPSITNITLLVIAAAAPFVGVLVASGVPRNRPGSRRIDLVQRRSHVADARLHRDGWPHGPAVRHAPSSLRCGRARARRALPAAHGRRRVERARVAAVAHTVRLVGGAAPVRRQPRASRSCCSPPSPSPSARSRSHCRVSATSATGSCASATRRRCKPACCSAPFPSSGVKAPAG